MGEIDRSRNLTQTELAAVLRRAAELDSESALPVPTEGLDPLVVEAAAVEAGLSPRAVRQALGEVMRPAAETPDPYAGGLLPARELVMRREVPGPAHEVEKRIGRFLRGQVFEQKRIFADGSAWEPQGGWAGHVRRGVDLRGRLILQSVRKVAVSVAEIDDADSTVGDGGGESQGATAPRVSVRISLDVSAARSAHAFWLAGGAVSGAAVVGVTGALAGLDPLTLMAFPVAGGLTAGGHFVGRSSAQHVIEKIHTGVAGLLDRLEYPDRDRPSRQSRIRAGRRRSSSAGSRDRTGGEN